MKRQEKIHRLNQTIEDFYLSKSVAPLLLEAILYSVQAGGKRVRPLLLLELVEGFGFSLTSSHYQVAAALEMIHTGSLIHDDLPAMDNDDYRRGQLTNHKKFGEDLAILAGDSLFLDPPVLIANSELPSDIKVDLIRELSQASGRFGMVAGQTLDMMSEGKELTLEELQTIHSYKTGKLFLFPFQAAAIIAGLEPKLRQKLDLAGESLGLAFQIRDDILDVTASFSEIGKTPQKDIAAKKSTYPAFLGLEGAKKHLQKCLEQAEKELSDLEKETRFDAQFVREIIESLRLDE